MDVPMYLCVLSCFFSLAIYQRATNQNFTTKISVTKSMCEKKERKNVNIELKGSKDALKLNIECAKCQSCEGNKDLNSSICMYKGDYVCGGCQCM